MKTSDRNPLGKNTKKEDKSTINEPYARPRKRSSRSRTLNRLIPLLILLIFGTLILKDKVPAVSDKIDSVINPQGFAAVQTCRKAALSQSSTPDFARLIKSGRANATKKGFFVDQLVIGEMDDQGGERLMDVGCHIDQSGELIKLSRLAYKEESTIKEDTESYHERLTTDVE